MLQREPSAPAVSAVIWAVIHCDLDHFKNVNDTYGILLAIPVLAEAARRMAGVVRPYDSVGRYGGESFLIVSCRQRQPVYDSRCKNRLRAGLSSDSIDVNGVKISITGSFGVCRQ